MNTKRIGDISEAKILATLIGRGCDVLIPFGDNLRYDLLIDVDGSFERIQCKTGRLRAGVIIFKTSSSTYHRSTGCHKHYRGQAEWFGVYCPDNKKTYLVPVDRVGASEGTLRVDEPRNNQKKRITWAHEFEI